MNTMNTLLYWILDTLNLPSHALTEGRKYYQENMFDEARPARKVRRRCTVAMVVDVYHLPPIYLSESKLLTFRYIEY